MATAEQATWQIVYPVYLNAKRKRKEGRRIATAKAVDSPTVKEVDEACKKLGLQTLVEPNKCYSRDFLQRGRVRVLLKKDKEPVNEELRTSKAYSLLPICLSLSIIATTLLSLSFPRSISCLNLDAFLFLSLSLSRPLSLDLSL